MHRERDVEGPRVVRRELRGSVKGGPGEGDEERRRECRWGVLGRLELAKWLLALLYIGAVAMW